MLSNPIYALILDTIPSGDTPEINTEHQHPVWMGKGPVCPLRSGFPSAEIYNVTHPKVQEIIANQEKELGMSIQYLTVSEALYITDAPMVSRGHKGVPLATLAVPRRYSHSPIEMININDAVDMVKLLSGIVRINDNYDLSFI